MSKSVHQKENPNKLKRDHINGLDCYSDERQSWRSSMVGPKET